MLQKVARPSDADSRQQVMVRHLRQVLLWPLRLIPAGMMEDDPRRRAPWQALRAMGDASPWREHVDEYQGAAGRFHERHYNEFVSFLPYVQRFLYGEGRAQRGGEDATTGSPMRVFRRSDIAAGASSRASATRLSRCRWCTSTCTSSTASTSSC
jgi:hypothetical protein